MEFAWYEFLPKLLNMSLTASVIILFLLLIRFCMRKAPKIFSYMLWGIVLFRLICPVSVESRLSVFNLFDTPVTESGVMEYIPENVVHTEYPHVSLPVPAVNAVINEALPKGKEQLVADPLEAYVSIATYLWMIGAAAMITVSVVKLMKLKRLLIGSVHVKDNIYLADHIDSPFVIGLFYPKIYLPSNLDEREQEFVLLHEKHHIFRGDHFFKLLSFLALCIHWFNPLVWTAFILSGKDMEMSCDEAVMKKIGSDIRADYSASLLRFATGRKIIAGTPLAFGEGDTKARVKNVMKYKKPALWLIAVAIIVCLAVCLCFLTNPMEPKDTNIILPEEVYRVSEVVYSAPQYSFVMDLQNAPSYRITSDLRLFESTGTAISSQQPNSLEWSLCGVLSEISLTKKTFDALFDTNDYVVWQSSKAELIRSNNKTAWRVFCDTNNVERFYYVLEQQNGDMYLCFGYPDPEGETDPASDDSHIRWLFHLSPADSYESSVEGTISADMTAVQRNKRIYYFNDSVEPVIKPSVILDDTTNTFQFTFSMFSSYIANGTYKLDNDRLILRTNDGFDYIYVFDVVDDTFIFDADSSSRIPTYTYAVGEDSQCPVPDGAVFTLSGKAEQDVPTNKDDSSSTDSEVSTGPISVTNYYDRIPISSEDFHDTLDAAISDAIHARYKSDLPDGLIHVESHKILLNGIACGVSKEGEEELAINENILYLIVMYKTYAAYDGTLTEVESRVIPTYLRISQKGKGPYALEEYWEPRDGSLFHEDIYEKFPKETADQAINGQKDYIVQLDAECRSKALVIMNRGGSLSDHIASLLEIICSSPALSSSPAAYIEEHKVSYLELVEYDEFTLRYCFSEFLKGGQTDLRGHIMAAACREIMEKWQEKMPIAQTASFSGQDWFNAFVIYSEKLLDEHGEMYLEKYNPGSWLLMQMLDQ